MEATAYWTIGPRQGALRRQTLPDPGPDHLLVRALASGVSRGTELLVHRHEVPEAVRDAMRAPFQVGDLPGEVKYGYLSVGVVEAGPPALVGRRVFCLHPHQDRYVVPAAAVTLVPDASPMSRTTPCWSSAGRRHVTSTTSVAPCSRAAGPKKGSGRLCAIMMWSRTVNANITPPRGR